LKQRFSEESERKKKREVFYLTVFLSFVKFIVGSGWKKCMGHRWNDTDRKRLKYWEKNIIQRVW
jgi:hypothetical protein